MSNHASFIPPALALVLAGTAAGGADVLCDDFNDGVIDPGWAVIGNAPAVIVPAEQNQRLEFPAAAGGDDAFAGLVSLWTLDATQDFQIKVDYTAAPPAFGEVGHSFAVIFSGEIAKGEIVDGFVLDAGHEFGAPFHCVSQLLGGLEFSTCAVSAGAGTTMYMWYDAKADRLWGSFIGFDDPTANSGIDLRASSGADRVQIALIGFVAQRGPAVAGSDLYLDDFCAVTGTVLPPLIPGDVDGDGAVGLADLLTVLSTWGPCPGCAADIDGDGTVGFGDLLIVLGNWTP